MAIARQLYTVSIFSMSTLKSMARDRHAITRNIFSRKFTSSQISHDEKVIKVTFVNEDGYKVEATGEVNSSMAKFALNNTIFMPYKICNGDLHCSECNFVFKNEYYNKLPKPNHDEMDFLTRNNFPKMSRMGCQIKMTEDLNGIEIQVPKWQPYILK